MAQATSLTLNGGYRGVENEAGATGGKNEVEWGASTIGESPGQEIGERPLSRASGVRAIASLSSDVDQAIWSGVLVGAGWRCRICVLRPRLTGTPHSQLRLRFRHRAQIGRSSPHFTLRRRQVLQPDYRPKRSAFPRQFGTCGLGTAFEKFGERESSGGGGKGQDQPFFERGAFRPDMRNQTPPSRVSRSRGTKWAGIRGSMSVTRGRAEGGVA